MNNTRGLQKYLEEWVSMVPDSSKPELILTLETLDIFGSGANPTMVWVSSILSVGHFKVSYPEKTYQFNVKF